MALAPGTRGYTKAIVAAQMLAQIGAFALPALLPDYMTVSVTGNETAQRWGRARVVTVAMSTPAVFPC
jgi:hypothetical protein